jgi:hypothetical protein
LIQFNLIENNYFNIIDKIKQNIKRTGEREEKKMVTKSYGVSLPLSLEFPTLKDKDLSEKLDETLRKYNVFETESELRHRMDVLHKINTLYKNWIKTISMNKVESKRNYSIFKNS